MDIIEIYSNPNDFTEGIYGQCLSWLLEVLYSLEKNNIIKSNTKVIFNINTLNNSNLIPKFIQQKNIYDIGKSIEPKKISLSKYFIETVANNKLLGNNTESFEKANKIFNNYFKFNDFIINEVNKLNINNKTLGVHYRGTDKNYDIGQSNCITKTEMILIIQDYIKNNDVEQIFCCSDEQSFIDEIKILYPNKLIEYIQSRSNHSLNYGFFRNGQNNSNQDNLTYSCIIDMLALSKCSTIIKTSSALSCFSKNSEPFS